MKKKPKEKKISDWIVTRLEVADLVGIRRKNLPSLERWVGIKMTPGKSGYSPTEFAKIKKRVAELHRHVTR